MNLLKRLEPPLFPHIDCSTAEGAVYPHIEYSTAEEAVYLEEMKEVQSRLMQVIRVCNPDSENFGSAPQLFPMAETLIPTSQKTEDL